MSNNRQGPVFIEEPCGCRVDHGIPYRCSRHALPMTVGVTRDWDLLQAGIAAAMLFVRNGDYSWALDELGKAAGYAAALASRRAATEPEGNCDGCGLPWDRDVHHSPAGQMVRIDANVSLQAHAFQPAEPSAQPTEGLTCGHCGRSIERAHQHERKGQDGWEGFYCRRDFEANTQPTIPDPDLPTLSKGTLMSDVRLEHGCCGAECGGGPSTVQLLRTQLTDLISVSTELLRAIDTATDQSEGGIPEEVDRAAKRLREVLSRRVEGER